MARITSLEQLGRLRDEVLEKRRRQADRGTVFITVGMGTCGIAAGALDVFRAVQSEIEAHQLKTVLLAQTGCMGLCTHEPILEVTVGTAAKVSYGHVQPQFVKRIVQEHVLEGRVVEALVIDTTPFPTI